MGSGIYSVASIKHMSQKWGALEVYTGRTLDSGKGTGQGRSSLPMGLFADSLLNRVGCRGWPWWQILGHMLSSVLNH